MDTMQYKAVKLVKRPGLTITPDLFETVVLETPELADGQMLLKQTHMSLDPAMKGWMTEDRNSYIPPVELGEVMRSSGVAEVVESRNEDFSVGDRVQGMIGWTEYAVSDGQGLHKLPPGISAEAVLCVLSLPGLTAYQGFIEIGKPKKGETLVVSGAAGSVGSMVGQLAKAEGLRVIGTAGTDDKCRWLEDELGFDKAINYKSDDLARQLSGSDAGRRRYLFRKHRRCRAAHYFRSHECAWPHRRLRHDPTTTPTSRRPVRTG